MTRNIKQETLIKNISIAGIILLLAFAFWYWRNNIVLTKKNQIIEQQQNQILLTNLELENLNQGLEQKISTRTKELRKANDELVKKTEEILLALVEGQTIERKRVASELHDNLGATISAIKWRLEAINSASLNAKEQKVYESTVEMIKGAYSEIRLISHNLLPAELEKGGFKGALEKFIADINSSEKLHIVYNLEPDAIPIDKKFQLELYSIALELINNILKHANAKNIHINLYKRNLETFFEISDDGKGLNTHLKSDGMGMKNIQNRVQALNATIEYLPQPVGLKILIKVSNLHS